MKEFKGTKGEWVNGWGEGLTGPTTPRYPNPTADDNREYTPISIGKETIAIIIQQENNKIEELKANAKIIAAAPELLKALQTCLRRIRNESHEPFAIIEALNAINKALN